MEFLDRHALVVAIWSAAGFLAVVLFKYGLSADSSPAILAAFGVIFAAFIGHVITNAVVGLDFTTRELALGLVVYAGGLIVFLLSVLFSVRAASEHFVAISIGLLAVFVTVAFYLIAHFGLRRAFRAFDVVRDFSAASSTSDKWREESGR
jgi:uncharacterized protein YacL